MHNLLSQVLIWGQQNGHHISKENCRRIELLEGRAEIYHSLLNTQELALIRATILRSEIRGDLLYMKQILPHSIYDSFFGKLEKEVN